MPHIMTNKYFASALAGQWILNIHKVSLSTLWDALMGGLQPFWDTQSLATEALFVNTLETLVTGDPQTFWNFN